MASTRASVDAADGSSATVAVRVTRLTFASLTPGIASKARSTRRTQLAQVMPSMGRSMRQTAPSSVSWGAGTETDAVDMITSRPVQTQDHPADYGKSAGAHRGAGCAAGVSG